MTTLSETRSLAIFPERFGIAAQLDGTICIKNDKRRYLLDENRLPQLVMDIQYPGRLHNALAVHPISGSFYSIGREQD